MAVKKRKKSAKAATESTGMALLEELSTGLAEYEDELREIAKKDAKREKASQFKYFSTRGGVFSLGEDEIGDVLDVCILDFSFENGYYPGAYDPQNTVPPECFAVGMAEADLAPSDVVKSPESDKCETCWANKFKSADNGRGKACKNQRRLAIVAGDHDSLNALSSDTDIAMLRLPPTSLTNWAKYYTKITEVVGKPLWSIVTRIKITKETDGFTIDFEPVGMIEGHHIKPLQQLREIAQPALVSLPEMSDDSAPAASGGKKKRKKKVAKKKTAAKSSTKDSEPVKTGVRKKRKF